ncbi:MAG TPA: glycoside hydrolase family 43 protein [Polyangiaceae bacterium]|nr:glycoside hydrolase family 43 protein [Polyangiaceae bacterium]
MKWYRAGRATLCAMGLVTVPAIPSPARADNPIVQTSYTADPAPMVHEGRLYLYTSHDEDVTVDNFYTMNDWKLYSTADMVNWTDHGTPAALKTFSWGTDNAWAPQGIARNGKFYLYVPLNNNTGAKIGVGVSNTVTGPFMDPLGKALAASGSGNIDPTVFVDDDGQAYMYWGNGTLRYVKLNSDMTSTSGSISNVSMTGFTEGPWFYKRASLYYLVYAATSGNEKISYATSNGPTGPWTVRGDIMGPGSTFTNHAGIVDYKGHSYFFYHNGTLPGGSDFKRSVCVEEFSYGADGSIPKLTMSTKGPTAVATLDPFKQVEAETIAFSSGLKTQVCTDTGAGMNVSSISNGDYIKVKDVDFLDGVTSFEARVSSATSDAKIELHLDSQTGTLLGTCDVSGASSWTTKTCAVSGGSGKHDLFLKFVGGSGELFKFNWWRFAGPTMPNGGGGSGGTGPGTGGVGGSAQGMSGSAGAAATTSGSGGSLSGGSGGTTGTAGSGSGGSPLSSAGAVSGGTAGAAGRAGSTPAAAGAGGNGAAGGDDPSSCACRAGASTGNGGLTGALALIASALVLRRRRR